MLRRINDFFSEVSRTLVFILGFSVVALLGAVYYFFGTGISSALFFVIPIVFVSWYAGKWPGVIISFLSAASLMVADAVNGFPDTRVPVVVWNGLAPLGFFLIFIVLLANLKTAFMKEEKMSRTDPLTGLLNRRYFKELAGEEIERCRRYGHPFSLAYMDLDNFKEVNDTHGHDTGDRVLETTSDLFKRNLRSTDHIARLGGDEFAILLPEAGAEAGALVMLKIRDLFLDKMRENGWPVTISIGLVTYTHPPDSVQDMLRDADGEMYTVKNDGKNDIRQEVF